MYFRSKLNKVFYIAEIGSNHEGNFQLAKKLTYNAIKSGADAIKFQIFDCETLVNKKIDLKRYKHFKRLQLNINQFIELAKICKKNNKFFMASVWDRNLLKKINPFIKIHKVGSGDLTNFQLIDDLVKTKKPIIISTGLSSLKTIDKVVNFIKKKDKNYLKQKKLSILQCTSNYPNQTNQVNLKNIEMFEERYNLPIGFSDHTIGFKACEVAYIVGAKIIEKHFTHNKKIKTFRDHKISMTSNEVKLFLQKLSTINDLLGNKKKELLNSEKKSKNHLSFRRGIYAKTNIKKGEKFSEKNLILLRPLKGIGSERYFEVIGKKSLKNFKPLDIIKF